MADRMGDYALANVGELRFEPVTRRIRCLVDGETVVDTTEAMLLWEPRRVVPVYAVPTADITADRLDAAPAAEADLQALPPMLGPQNFRLHSCPGEVVSITVAGRVLEQVGFRPDAPEIGGRVALEWHHFDWIEEEQPVVGHPHDPFTRIDVLPSSRQVVVSLDGQILAESTHPSVLYETHLPPRWYLPREDVRMELLDASDTVSTCAYKGHASYFSLTGSDQPGRDIAWTYTDPLHDAAAVQGLICFFSERTDLEVDGTPMARPETFWSPGKDQDRGPEFGVTS